MYRSL